MSQFGKPLAFYLKYMAEMQRLYEPDDAVGQPDLTGLANAERVLEMARSVGAAASEQAADFLESCGKGIEDHFTRLGIATLSNRKRRAAVVRDWSWWIHVHVPSMRDGWFSCAVWITAPPLVRISLDNDVCGVVVPYLWSKGGRKGEDAVWKILGGWAHSRGVDGVGEYRGSVYLGCIPVKARPPESFDLDRDQLIAEVMKPITRIGVEQTRVIASFVAGLNEPDDG